eukprot:6190714-Pleurochrysis_carterae.AAC.1
MVLGCLGLPAGLSAGLRSSPTAVDELRKATKARAQGAARAQCWHCLARCLAVVQFGDWVPWHRCALRTASQSC